VPSRRTEAEHGEFFSFPDLRAVGLGVGLLGGPRIRLRRTARMWRAGRAVMCTALVSLGLSDSVTQKRLGRVQYWAITHTSMGSIAISCPRIHSPLSSYFNYCGY
jgi:hypothetical protein